MLANPWSSTSLGHNGPKENLLICSACEGNAKAYISAVALLQILLYPWVISMGCLTCVESSKKNLVETWSSVSLPFVLYYFKEMLVSKSEGFNHLACEGVVSLISHTLVLASFKKIFAALVSLVPVRSDQPFQRGMKAAFPHLKNKKTKKRRKRRKKKK